MIVWEMAVVLHYLREAVCASWADTPDKRGTNAPEPLSEMFSSEDIAPESRAVMEAEALDFFRFSREWLADLQASTEVARQFWLVRNGVQTRFMEGARGWLKPGAEAALTARAITAGTRRLVVGDDWRLYQVTAQPEGGQYGQAHT